MKTIKKYFTKIGNQYITLSERGVCYALNTHPRSTKLEKRIDNYIIEVDPMQTKNKYNIRRLTPVECERLQAFPDNWTEKGVDDEPISDTQRYKCLGNAVTTTVITHIIEGMFEKVFEED